MRKPKPTKPYKEWTEIESSNIVKLSSVVRTQSFQHEKELEPRTVEGAISLMQSRKRYCTRINSNTRKYNQKSLGLCPVSSHARNRASPMLLTHCRSRQPKPGNHTELIDPWQMPCYSSLEQQTHATIKPTSYVLRIH